MTEDGYNGWTNYETMRHGYWHLMWTMMKDFTT